MVDGGLDYMRCSAHGDEVCLSLYNDEPHEVQRDILEWGTFGKDGKEELMYVKIKDMETSHIKAVLEECNPSMVYRNCFEEELKRRLNNRSCPLEKDMWNV
jgi:hypothetical protein